MLWENNIGTLKLIVVYCGHNLSIENAIHSEPFIDPSVMRKQRHNFKLIVVYCRHNFSWWEGFRLFVRTLDGKLYLATFKVSSFYDLCGYIVPTPQFNFWNTSSWWNIYHSKDYPLILYKPTKSIFPKKKELEDIL